MVIGSLICVFCDGRDLARDRGSRVLLCRGCGKEVWLTAGSFFHRKKLLRPWLAAIWMMEHGVFINASQLKRLLNIAYSSAHYILRSLACVVEEQSSSASELVPSSVFLQIFARRSSETPAREHPREEERVLQEQEESHENLDNLPVDLSGLPDAQQEVYMHLAQGPLSVDHLCARTGLDAGPVMAALTMLELDGLIQQSSGVCYERVMVALQGPFSEGALKAIDGAIGYVQRVFGGISRKYLQSYIASYWCSTDKRRWGPGDLLEACLRRGDKPTIFMTPLMVRITV
ncbi:MAG: hypothetical protein KC777_04280 [Cyanobacteria bacterium HKST-UBA02]|nr:hypothetical protein [Cyanobacteria bacterium HKST-UBA02]